MKFNLVLLLMPVTQKLQRNMQGVLSFYYMDILLKDVRNMELLEKQHSVN